MRIRKPITAAGIALFTAAAFGASAVAQSQLEVLKQEIVSGVPGLRVVTMRDNQIAQCYTLFIMEPSTSGTPAPPQVDVTSPESVQRIREAAENYDRQIAELNAQFEAKTRRPPLETWNNLSGWPYTFTSVVQYELDRTRIANEYQRALQLQIPSSAPFATSAPGMRTGSWQDLSDAVQRAIATSTPGTQQTVVDTATLGTVLETGFKRLMEAPRLAASGPTPCASDAK